MTQYLRDYLENRKHIPNNGAKYRNNGKQNKIEKSRLPEPRSFYNAYDITLKGSKGWQLVKCSFHDDSHASMGINREHGGFKCHACGASGDRISFYMRYHGVSFIDACKALGIAKEGK